MILGSANYIIDMETCCKHSRFQLFKNKIVIFKPYFWLNFEALVNVSSMRRLKFKWDGAKIMNDMEMTWQDAMTVRSFIYNA